MLKSFETTVFILINGTVSKLHAQECLITDMRSAYMELKQHILLFMLTVMAFGILAAGEKVVDEKHKDTRKGKKTVQHKDENISVGQHNRYSNKTDEHRKTRWHGNGTSPFLYLICQCSCS